MAHPTPVSPGRFSAPTVYRDDCTLDGHVIFTLTTACGHSAEVATINAVWLDRHPEVEAELWASLDHSCHVRGEHDGCASCPFVASGRLRVV
jgi:hypothetical protein